MMYVKCLCLILTVCVGHVSLHENYPPGIPPPNSQQGHQHQAPQGNQQAYPNQGQQGHPNQGQQGHPNQGQQGHPNQGQQGHPNQGQQGHPNQDQQGHPNQAQQGQNLQFQAGQQQQQNVQATGHYEDVNVQNMQQGSPPASGHGHQHGGFRQKEQVHNAEHIREHLKEVIDKPKEEMTEEELEFHYFKLHDYDSNNKLDGTEITKAITHFHDDHENATPEEQEANKKVFSDEELSNIVEMVLKEDDLDMDGYITYTEFVKAQRKAQTPENTKP